MIAELELFPVCGGELSPGYTRPSTNIGVITKVVICCHLSYAIYRQISDKSRTFVGNLIVDH